MELYFFCCSQIPPCSEVTCTVEKYIGKGFWEYGTVTYGWDGCMAKGKPQSSAIRYELGSIVSRL